MVYHHVPKSAGTSVSNALDMMLGACYSRYGDRQGCVPPLTGYSCYVGHWTPALPTRCCRMTVLREPVDRTLSSLHFNGVNDAASQLETLRDTRGAMYFNKYVRFFSSPVWDTFGGDGALGRYDAPRDLTEDDYRRAIRTLLAMDLVCLTSELDGCMRRVYDMMERVPRIEPLPMQRRNVNAQRRAVPDERVLRAVEASTRMDAQIYAMFERNGHARL